MLKLCLVYRADSAGQGEKLFAYNVDNTVSLREEVLLKLKGGGYPVAGAEDCRRSIEVVKRHLCNVGSHVAHDASAVAGVAYDNDASRLLNALYDLFIVEGNDGARVDDLCGDAVLFLQACRQLPLHGRELHRLSGS